MSQDLDLIQKKPDISLTYFHQEPYRYYGTTVLKFEEIEAQRIPKAVLTVMKSHTIW